MFLRTGTENSPVDKDHKTEQYRLGKTDKRCNLSKQDASSALQGSHTYKKQESCNIDLTQELGVNECALQIF